MRRISVPFKTSITQLVDLNFLSPEHAVGARPPPESFAHLHAAGFRRIVDTRLEEQDDANLLESHGLQLLSLPTEDLQPLAMEQLWEGVKWVNEGLERGEPVYVHCQHGIGRSALLSCCVLVSRGLTPRNALLSARRARPKVSPSPDQLHALLEWAAAWRESRGEPVPSCTWDELAHIAYRFDGAD